MAASIELLKKLAEESLKAERGRYEIDNFYKTYADMDERDGYVGQKLRLEMMQAEGHQIVGYKLGGTSLAKMQQVATTMTSGAYTPPRKPAFGTLMDYMQIGVNDDVVFDELIHPKLETELAFVMKEELYGPNITAADVMMATAYVTPAFEIIDSRFMGFKMGGKADALIDNVSSARFKLGRMQLSPFDVDMVGMGVRCTVNGEIVDFGAGGAVMGHPARAVASLVGSLYEQMDMPLPKGAIILSGAICPSRFIHKGDFIVSEFGGLGSVETHVV